MKILKEVKVKVHKYIESVGFNPVEEENNIEIQKYKLSMEEIPS